MTRFGLRRKSRKFINHVADVITKKSFEVIFINRIAIVSKNCFIKNLNRKK